MLNGREQVPHMVPCGGYGCEAVKPSNQLDAWWMTGQHERVLQCSGKAEIDNAEVSDTGLKVVFLSLSLLPCAASSTSRKSLQSWMSKLWPSSKPQPSDSFSDHPQLDITSLPLTTFALASGALLNYDSTLIGRTTGGNLCIYLHVPLMNSEYSVRIIEWIRKEPHFAHLQGRYPMLCVWTQHQLTNHLAPAPEPLLRFCHQVRSLMKAKQCPYGIGKRK